MMWWHGGGAGWLMMVLATVVLWGLIAGLAYGVLRGAGPARAAAAVPRDDARKLLDERFARGELDEEQYRRRRDLLSGAE